MHRPIIMPPPLIGGGIKRWCCLTSDVCLSVAYIGPKSRTERPRKTKIGTEVAHVTRDSDTTFKVKRSKVKSPGRFAWLFKSLYMDDTLPPRASRCLSIMNIHGARRAGRKACMGCSWAAACGVQGRAILRGFPHSLFRNVLHIKATKSWPMSAMSALYKCIVCAYACICIAVNFVVKFLLSILFRIAESATQRLHYFIHWWRIWTLHGTTLQLVLFLIHKFNVMAKTDIIY